MLRECCRRQWRRVCCEVGLCTARLIRRERVLIGGENNDMSTDTMQAELDRLRAENEALKSGNRGKELSFKVSPKGAVSVYGMGRFPVTLYKEQWLRLLDKSGELLAFIAANDAQLKSKE